MSFNQLCEHVINDGGNVRELVQNAMIVNGSKVKREIKEIKSEEKEEDDDGKRGDGPGGSGSGGDGGARKKMSLIDEVDVFFSNEFYGQNYSGIAGVNTNDLIEKNVNINNSGGVDNDIDVDTRMNKVTLTSEHSASPRDGCVGSGSGGHRESRSNQA